MTKSTKLISLQSEFAPRISHTMGIVRTIGIPKISHNFPCKKEVEESGLMLGF